MKKNIKYWLRAGIKLVGCMKSPGTSPKESSTDSGTSPEESSTASGISPEEEPAASGISPRESSTASGTSPEEVTTDSGTPEPPIRVKQSASGSSYRPLKDYVSYVSDMVSRIIEHLDHLLQATSLNPSDHVLQVYISDDFLYKYCLNQDFVKQLEERMSMERSYTFAACSLHSLPTKPDVPVTEVMPDVFIRLQRKDESAEIVSATVRVLDGYGSLLEEPVLLDGSKLSGGKANIGVGRQTLLDNGSIRMNTIAVDDSTDSPQYERNKYVSRSHAHILFRNGKFLLCVETGGTSRSGKRTAVSRNGRLIKLDVEGMGIILEDGDQIILSKNVVLLFEKKDSYGNF